MINKIMLKFGFVNIKVTQSKIDELIHKYKNKVPSEKFKDGRKNVVFFKERMLMNEFNNDLHLLKLDIKL